MNSKIIITCAIIALLGVAGYFYYQNKEVKNAEQKVFEKTQSAEKRAFEDKLKLCDSDDAGSCADLAYMYFSGKGVTKDIKKAFTYNKKACDMGEFKNCTYVASAYYNGEGVEYDYQKALQYHILACENGANASSCGMLGYQYSMGRGTKKDKEKAKFYNKKACEMGNEKSCQYAN